MGFPDTWSRFVGLVGTTADALPVYLLLAVLPVVALGRGGWRAGLRGLTGVLLAHLAPIAMLYMGAAMFGEGRSNWRLQGLHTAIGVAGVVLVVGATKSLRPLVPPWAFTLFFVGVAIMSLMAWLISGMALVDDWL
ncbi:MAG: hypothetical protein ABI988_14740 [Nitrospirota bacterium]